MYQITEMDLEMLERELPAILGATMEACNDPMMRKRWAAVQEVVKNVRWNYGPPSEIETIDAGD